MPACVGGRAPGIGVVGVRVRAAVRGRAGPLGGMCARCSRPRRGTLGEPDAAPSRGRQGPGQRSLRVTKACYRAAPRLQWHGGGGGGRLGRPPPSSRAVWHRGCCPMAVTGIPRSVCAAEAGGVPGHAEHPHALGTTRGCRGCHAAAPGRQGGPEGTPPGWPLLRVCVWGGGLAQGLGI